MFDRILQKGATAQNGDAGEPSAEQTAIVYKAGSDVSLPPEAAAPWQQQDGDDSPQAGDEIWMAALAGELDELPEGDSDDDLAATHIDQSVLAVIATTIAAGHVSHQKSKKKTTRRNPARQRTTPLPLNQDR